MVSRASEFITQSWYKGAYWLYLLFPLALLYRGLVFIRKQLYQRGIFKTYHAKIPVVIVGNITVGGTGKSPLVSYLVKSLKEKGFTPGVVSRGYGSTLGKNDVREVYASSLVSDVGDEPLMLKRALDCTVVVSPSRVLAVQMLERMGCDIVIADDGMQHYALTRDVEICVFDGERKWGNGYILPMGPMREPLSRMQECDFMVINGADWETSDLCQLSADRIFRMDLRAGELRSVSGSGEMALGDLKGASVNAVAAIGNPERFFSVLRKQAVVVEPHAFEDHHLFTASDFLFLNSHPIIMTEKDAVKCQGLNLENAWYLPVSACFNNDMCTELVKVLKTKGWLNG